MSNCGDAHNEGAMGITWGAGKTASEYLRLKKEKSTIMFRD